MDDDWKAAWQPLMEAVGTDFGNDVEVWGADDVEKGIIRRFLEPLEFDCPLHYDKATAQHYGYPDLLAPYSSVLSSALPALWALGGKSGRVQSAMRSQHIVPSLRQTMIQCGN